MNPTEETTMVQAAENTELSLLINNSGVELLEAQEIAKNYLPFIERNNSLNLLMEKIDFDNPTILDEKNAREIRLLKVKVRTDADKTNQIEKKADTVKANFKQSLYNHIKNGCQSDEEKLLQVEKKREIAEAARIAKLQTERVEQAKEYGVDATNFPLGTMDEDAWMNQLEGYRLVFEKKAEEERKAKEEQEKTLALDKVERERKLEIAPLVQFMNGTDGTDLRTLPDNVYNSMLESLKKSKSEYDAEQERIRLENAKLLKEKEAADLKLKEAEAKRIKEQEASDKLLNEQRKLAEDKAKKLKVESDKKLAEQKAIADKKLKDEQEAKAKLEKQLQAKKDADALAEKNRLAEEKKKEDEAKKLAKSSDKNKLTVWVDSMAINLIDTKNLTPDSIRVAEEIFTKFKAFQTWSKTQIETL